MKRVTGALLAALVVGTSASARAQDSTEVDGPRAEQLRRMIEERFADRLMVELGLTGDQASRTRSILVTWGGKRRSLEKDQRGLRQQLTFSMRPGVAANEAAVTRLVDNLATNRVAYAQTFRDELVDLAPVLTPVQRAQYVLLRDRLLQRVQEIRNQRQEARQQLPGPRRGRFRP